MANCNTIWSHCCNVIPASGSVPGLSSGGVAFVQSKVPTAAHSMDGHINRAFGDHLPFYSFMIMTQEIVCGQEMDLWGDELLMDGAGQEYLVN